MTQQLSLKELANKVLERNRTRNHSATDTKNIRNFHPNIPPQKLRKVAGVERRHVYHFKLKNNQGGGTYLTHASTLSEARAELEIRYAGRILMISGISGEMK